MKRMIRWVLALMLLWMPCTGFAQAYISIDEMRTQGIPRWTQAYETEWRTVEIDVQPTVPDVERMPVLTVAFDCWEWDVSVLGEDWINEDYKDHMSFWFHNKITFEDTEDIIKRYQNKTPCEDDYVYPPFDFEKCYLPDNDATLNDVLVHAKSILITMGREDVSTWLDNPECVNPSYWNDENGDPIPMSGCYSIKLRQHFYGIPVIGHAKDGFNIYIVETPGAHLGLTLNYKSPDCMGLAGQVASETGCLAEDIPLCDFSVIQAAIESEIMDGHVRKVYEAELGHVLYNTPDITIVEKGGEWMKTAEFYAVPAWRVNCLYVDRATKELKNYDNWAYSIPERGRLEYNCLMINAQTGEVQERQSTDPRGGDYTGFLSWDDAGGKP